MPEPRPFAVQPIEAIDFLVSKLRMPTRMWTDIWQQMHARAFVVAGAQTDALVADFHDAITRALKDGLTLEHFRKDFDRIVAAHGWSYRGNRNWRSRVIFETNMRMAYSAGRWAQIQRVKRVRPYIRYIHADPELTEKHSRHAHAALHNLVLHVDDPFWDHYWPPNGWGCRCSVRSMSERDLKRLGLTVSQSPEIQWTDRTVNTADGPVSIRVPEGIAPGFDYNVGKAGFGRGAQALAMEKESGWDELLPLAPRRDLPPVPVDTALVQPLRGEIGLDDLRSVLREALGGDEAIVVDPAGGRVRITQAIVDHILEKPTRNDGRARYFGLMPELIEDPYEIWIGFAINKATGRSAIRRRYVKIVDIGDHVLTMIADATGGEWTGVTFFHGRPGREATARSGGVLLYRRSD